MSHKTTKTFKILSENNKKPQKYLTKDEC